MTAAPPAVPVAPSTTTETDSWVERLAVDEPPDDAILGRMIDGFKTLVNHHGGVQEYLLHILPDQTAKDKFADWLDTKIQMSPARSYAQTRPLPVGSTFLVRLQHFAFDGLASLQAPPEVKQSFELLDRYVNEGFLTEYEPIKIRDKCTDGAAPGTLPNFQLCYLKGQSRLLTLMAFIHYLYSHEEELPVLISQTASTIYCVVEPCGGSAQAELFQGMSISYRGGLRKAPSLVQWSVSLRKLHKVAGVQPLEAVAAWNLQAVANNRIFP